MTSANATLAPLPLPENTVYQGQRLFLFLKEENSCTCQTSSKQDKVPDKVMALAFRNWEGGVLSGNLWVEDNNGIAQPALPSQGL